MTNDTELRPTPGFESRPDLPIALIVGAGGMAMAIAQRIGQNHRIVLASLADAELHTGQDKLHELGVVSATVVCDITDDISVASLSEQLAELGPVTTLVHVVGVSPSMCDGPTVMRINLAGAARIESAVLPHMKSGGAAVFISSMAAHLTPDPSADLFAILDQPLEPEIVARLESMLGGDLTSAQAYPLSKIGVNRMVCRQALAWGKKGARILSLSPGLIDTPMGAVESKGPSGKQRGAMRHLLPLDRDGSMADIADVVAYLTSANASYISGTDILVDGGLTGAIRNAQPG